MNIENTAGGWPPFEADGFVVTHPHRVRFSQYIVCHVLVFLEACAIGATAAWLLDNHGRDVGDIRYAVSAGMAIGACILLVVFLSGAATYDRFASRLSIAVAAVVAATLMFAAMTFDGTRPLLAVASGWILLATVLMAKSASIVVRDWLRRRGHLTRLVAVAADDPAQRMALVRLLRRRDDIELVFAGSPSQFDILGESFSPITSMRSFSGHQAGEENIAALAGLAVTVVRVTPQDRLDLDAFDPIWGKKRVFGAWSAPASIITLPPLRGWRGVTKRAIDVLGAFTAIVLFSPVMLACAIALKLEGPGPVLFVQERAGYRNKAFRMLKFRSMRVAKADPTGAQLTLRNDPRVTRVGAFLRRTSADELPQLFNVLKGDMSLVGPRPHPKGAKAGETLYDDLIPHFYSRYRMKPGITGLAQVSGLRGNTETEQHLIDRFGRDMQYAAEWTPVLDIAILFRTVTHLLKGTNAF